MTASPPQLRSRRRAPAEPTFDEIVFGEIARSAAVISGLAGAPIARGPKTAATPVATTPPNGKRLGLWLFALLLAGLDAAALWLLHQFGGLTAECMAGCAALLALNLIAFVWAISRRRL